MANHAGKKKAQAQRKVLQRWPASVLGLNLFYALLAWFFGVEHSILGFVGACATLPLAASSV